MEYIKEWEQEIREVWFGDHTIKSMEGEGGFQRISWGEPDTFQYELDYVLSGNMVFVTGDLGDAVYSFSCVATLDNIKEMGLSYFTGKLTAHQRERWNFDDELAREQIVEYFEDWCNADVDKITGKDKELVDQLLNETMEWSDAANFENMGVFAIYRQTESEWFDIEAASCIADCGKRLSPVFIAYWVGLKMIVEQLEGTK